MPTLFDDTDVVRLGLNDGLELLDIPTDFVDFVVVEFGSGFDLLLDVETRAYIDDDVRRLGQVPAYVE